MMTSRSELRETWERVQSAAEQVLVGLDEPFQHVMIALFSGGHILLEGVPGTGKTLLARTAAQLVGGSFKRIQFTPDLMPSDIVGTSVFDLATSQFHVHHGPIFAQIVLADEINRAPAKTQAALLEAMEETQVTIEGTPYPLPSPFLVIATQNPVEYEGTYPLPEAQLDRFLVKVVLPVPPRNDEIAILTRHAEGFDPRDVAAAGVRPVASGGDIEAAQAAVKRVQVSAEVATYIVDIARATRESPSLSLGVSPRGATALLRAARAWAWLQGRDFVTPDDVKALAHATLVHRLGLRPEAELEGVDVAKVLSAALGSVPVPR
jgi:MoxR-like ATPase